jgi:Tfp pilus assembly protein PilN
MALVVVLVAETLLIGGTYLLLVQRAASQQAELAELRDRGQKLAQAVARQEAEAAELAAFTVQVDAIAERLDDHVLWTNLMTLLEHHTMPSVRYDNFAAGLSAHVLTLGAVAPSYRAMAEQIELFRAAPLVRDVRAEAGISEIDEAGRITGVKWSMVLDLDPAVWSALSVDKVKNPNAALTPAAAPVAAEDAGVPTGLDR